MVKVIVASCSTQACKDDPNAHLRAEKVRFYDFPPDSLVPLKTSANTHSLQISLMESRGRKGSPVDCCQTAMLASRGCSYQEINNAIIDPIEALMCWQIWREEEPL